MNYKVMIVDDEEIIREGLVNFVDWKSLGFEVVAKFEDGKEAIEYLEKNKVDLILTDVKMISVSGIELAKYVSENCSEIKVVILSGYREFEYAREAMKYNVSNYLLKPTKFNEIVEILASIKECFDKRNEETRKIEEEKQIYQEVIPLLRQQFFNDLIMGALKDKEEIIKRLKIAGLKINPDCTLSCLINIKLPEYKKFIEPKWQYGKEKFYLAIKNFIGSKVSKVNFYTISNGEDNIEIIGLSQDFKSIVELNKTVISHFDEVKINLEAMFGIDINVTVEHSFANIYEIALYKRSITIKTEPNREKHEIKVGHQDYDRLLKQQKLLISYVSACNFENVSNLFETLMEELMYMDINYIKNFCIDLFAMLSNRIKDFGIDLSVYSRGKFDYNLILKAENISEINKICKTMFDDIIECASNFRDTSQNQIIKKAKEYIKLNYNKDISLEEVADHVYLSPVYLSRIFKKESSENFVDYLVNVRMEKAIEILREMNYKTYEVSEKVGYKSSKYFSKLFKQYTGYTPSEYRNTIIKEG